MSYPQDAVDNCGQKPVDRCGPAWRSAAWTPPSGRAAGAAAAALDTYLHPLIQKKIFKIIYTIHNLR
jgi:hypothetical protein